MTRIVLRATARRDVDEAVDWYRVEAGSPVARRFAEALDSAYSHLRDHPLSGQRRDVSPSSASDIRRWHLRGFPYSVFYRLSAQKITILRVLHMARDHSRALSDDP